MREAQIIASDSKDGFSIVVVIKHIIEVEELDVVDR